MNPFQSFVVRVCRINLEDATVKFNVEQALRERWNAGDAHGYMRGQKEHADCLNCRLYLQDRMERQLQQQPPGKYSLYHKDMERKKASTQKLDPTHTDILQHAPRSFDSMIHGEQPRIHKCSMTRYSGTYPDETLHRTPIFLQDRKVG